MTDHGRKGQLEAKIRFLSNPDSYGGATRRVVARETHMSWVFLTDNHVYKLKKPVKHAFLDFSTLKKRRFFCEEELRLNRRLAAETYHNVVPLRRDRSGGFILGGDRGRVADWLVMMKRLPQADMLDERIRGGTVSAGDIRRLSRTLAEFYGKAQGEDVPAEEHWRRFFREQQLNREILETPEFALNERELNVLSIVEELLEAVRPEIEERVHRGDIVEGHGDLRPEHICLCQPLQIIDCLEFNRSMRMLDPYDELGYLGMECAVLGAPRIGPELIRAIAAGPHRPPTAKLMAFYGAFRAILRARLCLAHLLERPIRKPRKWRPLASRYLHHAKCETLRFRSREDRLSTC